MDTNTLNVVELCKRYGDVTALDRVSFAVRPGELFGFVGSNGAGKTTAMRIILGVLAADSGEVRVGHAPITPGMRARIGYMPEERGLYPKMAVLDQLVYLAQLHGCSADDAHTRTERWLARMDLRERRHDEVQKLSLGNQQRVQLAAALVHDPDVLVLDEPFSGLDPVAVDVMSAVLREKAAAGVPVVFSSHQLDLVERLCDRVGIIRDGQMVAQGAVDELTSAASSTLRVVAPEAPSGWASHLTGVRVLEEVDSQTVLQLEPSTDEQAVLRAALETGRVTEFSKQRPSLTELFRNVVTEGSQQ
ncbi:ABC-2 type transport system ATP-binding protein [Haloechinothrix alba]|uniref:ABC-2 type transport system ATP-binding protein n=1 Tax=Haloechinothrix alba TaxID=664784 RepID=A0A238XEU0_9PSEU|nr:ATP-binding cassette domain-containing protein [Haloechinothrix alba]SNR57118.1 ABC-2 type transport system ATP-binding protein [Haloechinothrix alba]